MGDITLDFDTPSTTEKHYTFANKLSKEEREAFNLVDNNPKPLDKHLNPFKKEMKVQLTDNIPARLNHATGPLKSIATVSSVLNRDYVNINFWDVYPNIIKNIHINDIVLIKNETIWNKIKYYSIKLLRKVLPF